MRTSSLTKLAVLSLIAACESSTPAEAPPSAPSAAEAPAPAAAPAVDEHAAHAAAAAAPAGDLIPVPAGAKVSFTAPVAGAKISGPATDGKVGVAVIMAAHNITVKPAGAAEAGSGHHHILIDGAALPAGTVVPKDETHLHFGQGQTEATLQLAPGKHTLVMQFADGLHRSYGPELSASIDIEVEAVGGSAAKAAPGTEEPEGDDEDEGAP